MLGASRLTQLIAAVVVASTLVTAARAQTGVSDDRVSLPDGPGSLDGLGDNAAVMPNVGTMARSIEIAVPKGHAGATPGLSLSYSSGGGSTSVGIGWSMAVPFVERMTSKGLPTYVDADRIVADGGDELVRVATAEPAVYRARFEGGFVRWTWHDRGAGDDGWWQAEYPDGSTASFGADQDGDAVESARLRSPDGIFRWHLVEQVDRYGHVVRYDYAKQGGVVPLIDQIGWVFDAGGAPRFTVTFDYEAREDLVSDARGGFNELLAHRLTGVHVYSGVTELRSYVLSYETYAASGGFSRLSGVEEFGKDGAAHPVAWSFGWSRALGGVCDGTTCEAPYLVDMGALGASLQARQANLIDLNGDALPDVVDTVEVGQPMRVHMNVLAEDGTQSFASPVASTVANASGFPLDSPYVQMLDTDGDGFTDVLNSFTGQVLKNDGSGDFASVAPLTGGGTAALPDFADDFQLGADQPAHVRFLDYDGDHKIDVLRSELQSTSIFRNLGDQGFANVPGVQAIGAGFADDRLEMADINGDGLLDPVLLRDGKLTCKLNLGLGRWTPAFFDVTNMPFSGAADLDLVELEDINNDGLDDVVVVSGSTVRYALNRNAATFDAVQTITSVQNGAIPARTTTTTVLFADMNANGSSDVVWIEADGSVVFLELFPIRPNLLTRVENGIGLVTEVSYGTVAQHRAREPLAWTRPVPMPMIVVDSIDSYTQSATVDTEVHSLVRYAYGDGFYDGIEKQFRGFGRVRMEGVGDADQETGFTTETYDVGATDPWRAGKLLTRQHASAAGPLLLTQNTWADAALGDVPTTGLGTPVRHVALTQVDETVQEARPASEWALARTVYAYDGWGAPTLERKDGVVSIGGAACAACTRADDVYGAPCGAQCIGDESTREIDTIPPTQTGGRWLIGLPAVERSFGRAGDARVAVTTTYYDGADFTGLAVFQATRGDPVRVSVKIDDDTTNDIERRRYDAHGNVVESVPATGSVADDAGHEVATYDQDGLLLLSEQQVAVGGDGVRRTLRTERTYDPAWRMLATASDWYVVEDGIPPAADWTKYAYDQHGRMSAIVQPGGDTLASPTAKITYELGAPFSRIIAERRSTVGGALDLVLVQCIDGFGREVQAREQLGQGSWAVDGFTTFNKRGQPVRKYQAYPSTSGACDAGPPTGGRFQAFTYDALSRSILAVEPDEDLNDGASRRRTEYRPLQEWSWDVDDEDADDANADTPKVVQKDGQGRAVAVQQLAADRSVLRRETFTYTGLGDLRSVGDTEGNEKVQTYDLNGRVLAVSDPDSGRSTFEYDAAGNVSRSVDARGKSVRFEYDALERKVAQWEEGDEEGTKMEWFFDHHPTCPLSTCSGGAHEVVGTTYPLGEDGVGRDSFGYDARGQNVYVAREVLGTSYEFRTEHDNAGRAVRQIYPGDRALDFTFDAADRVVKIDDVVDQITWGVGGFPQQATLANGATTTWTHDALFRLTGLLAKDASGGLITSLQLRRDRLDRIVEVTDDRDGPAALSQDAVYTYDALGRLTKAVLADGDHQYAYDALDRMTRRTGVDDLAYGAQDKPRALAQAGDTAYAYDEDGRMVERGADAYEHDGMGRLTRVVRGGAELVRYGYAAPDDRVLERGAGGVVLHLSSTFEVRDGVARILVGFDRMPVAELESAALQTGVFTDVAPVDAPDGVINAGDALVAALADDDDAPVRELLRAAARRLLVGDGEHVAFLHGDPRGSRAAVTDAAGVVVERFAYDPYGVVHETTAGQTEYAAFTGREHDLVTGLIPFGARDYDPHAGRWTSTDPAWQTVDDTVFQKLIDATGVYSYAGNDPVNLIDEDGQFVHALVGAVIGASVAVAVTIAKMHYAQMGPGAPKLSGWQKVRGIAMAAVIGGAVGALTGGVSAVGAAISGAADIAVERSKYRFRAGLQEKPVSAMLRAVQVGAHIVGIAASIAIPLGAASAGLQTTPESVKTFLQGAAVSLGTLIGGAASAGGSGVGTGIGVAVAGGKAVKKAILHKKHNRARIEKRAGPGGARLVKQGAKRDLKPR